MALSGRIRPLNPWLLVCLATCVAIGILAGLNPQYGLLAAVGLLFAVVTFMDLTLGFVLLTLTSFLDLLASSGSFSGSKVIGLVVLGSWVARIATRRNEDASSSFTRENPWLVVALLAMLAWSALSFAWASFPSTALGGAGRYALDMLLLPIAFAAVQNRRQLIWVLAAYVAGATLSALYGFAVPGDVGSRLTGSIGDPNAEATVLAASIALTVGLTLVGEKSSRTKALGRIVLVVLFIGLLTTVSREGILAFGAVLVGGVVFGGRWRRRAVAVLAVGVVVTVGYFFVFAPLAARERVTMADTSGRTSLWTVAWRIVKAHPLQGVGTDNFILVEDRYLNQPGVVLALYTVTAPKVVHNAYLESLADLGVPGLVTFVAVLAAAFSAGVKATWMFQRAGDTEMEVIARSVVLALVAVLTAETFVSSQYAKYLWLLIAVCPVLLAFARRSTAEVDAP